jgi:CheY-like chemotaxis protein
MKKRILLADDDARIRVMRCRFLESGQYEVALVKTGLLLAGIADLGAESEMERVPEFKTRCLKHPMKPCANGVRA